MAGGANSNEGQLLRRVLEEFGVEWTQVAIFAGVIFSAFGLDRFLDSDIWVLTTVASFFVVFVFRRQIPGRFPAVAAAATVFSLLGLYLGHHKFVGETELIDYLPQHRTVATLYVGLVTMVPLAIMTLSYRRQETLLGDKLPLELRQAVLENVVEESFYKRNQHYVVRVLAADQASLKVELRLSYILVNRGRHLKHYGVGLTPNGRLSAPEVKIGGEGIDVKPRYMTEGGLIVDWPFPPDAKGVEVEMVATVDYRSTDADLFITHVPATDFMIDLHFPDSVELDIQELLPDVVPKTRLDDGGLRYHVTRGVMAYQGFRLKWKPAAIAAAAETA